MAINGEMIGHKWGLGSRATGRPGEVRVIHIVHMEKARSIDNVMVETKYCGDDEDGELAKSM